ncbi:MAG: GNAT family N-acetyltransferase [Hyphomicrobiales bacterium]|nr:MAG: GNAT family N-acetyltransferase [Hyphomicrobiales bacterium]
MTTTPTLRAATKADIPAITAIYGAEVRNARASFELDPPSEAEMRSRWKSLVDGGYPYIVAEIDGEVAGFGYCGPYRLRPAYYWTVEDSVYVDPRFRGRSLGLTLLSEVMKLAEEAGFRQAVAVIGDSANHASVRLHARLGFRPVGTLQNVGYKHERWLDTVLMQKTLGEGAETAPKGK